MTSLPEQLSAARQLEAQLELFRTLTNQAFSSAQQLIALNLSATRMSFEQSSATVKQLMTVRDPRDLLAFGAQSEQQLQSMMNYGRELFSIASGARMTVPAQASAARAAAAASARPEAAAGTYAPPAAVAPAVTPSAAAPAPGEATAHEAAEAAPETGGARPSKKVVVATETQPEPEPVAKAKPIANAVGKMAAKPAAATHPLASPMPAANGAVEIPPIKPVEAAPPPAPVSGTPAIDVKQAEAPPSKGGRKK